MAGPAGGSSRRWCLPGRGYSPVRHPDQFATGSSRGGGEEPFTAATDMSSRRRCLAGPSLEGGSASLAGTSALMRSPRNWSYVGVCPMVGHRRGAPTRQASTSCVQLVKDVHQRWIDCGGCCGYHTSETESLEPSRSRTVLATSGEGSRPALITSCHHLERSDYPSRATSSTKDPILCSAIDTARSYPVGVPLTSKTPFSAPRPARERSSPATATGPLASA
jgi:hypothetical protein